MTAEHPASTADTDSFAVVEQTSRTAEQIGVAWEAGATVTSTDDAAPQVTERLPAAATVAVPPPPLRAVTMTLAVAAGTIGVIAAFLTVVSYRITGDIESALELKLNDISTNALVATLVAAGLLVVGGALGLSGRRFGTGLAGGAGLALAGFMGWIVGIAVSIIDTIKQGLANEGIAYRLNTTLDVGLWMAVAAALLGGVVFFLSLTGAGDDGHDRLHPAVGAVGALGILAIAVGPLLPMHDATLADNFNNDHAVAAALWWKGFILINLGLQHDPVPPLTTWLRVLVLLVVLVGGFIGFLAGSRWGLGVAAGSVGIIVWQWLTSLLEAGDWPFGPAGGNPGVEGFAPHTVTTVGVILVLVALIAGAAMLYRSRPSAAAATE